MIQREKSTLSIRKQCAALELARSTLHYAAKGESPMNLMLMRLIDEKFLQRPFLGVYRMKLYLRSLGHRVGEKRVRRLMRLMGLMAIYPKPNLSLQNKAHERYPYLLRDVRVERVNQVWSTDITYIRTRHGFCYLAAIIDWNSRHVLAWDLSNSLDGRFCENILREALRHGTPEIFNMDQGAQFTAKSFLDILRVEHADRAIKISMDGKGRALDNVFIERLWRTVKYEDVYLKDYETIADVRVGLQEYFSYYCHERPHRSLGDCTPFAVYQAGCERQSAA